MGNEVLKRISPNKLQALSEIQDRFGVSDTVKQLQFMMSEVTKTTISADTVNAACNCVQNLNLTIKTAISAAKFLSDVKENEM